MESSLSDKNKIRRKIAILEHQALAQKAEMEDELEVTREKLSGLGKIALGVGGGVVLAAILIGGLKRGHRKKIPSVNRSRVYHRFIDQLVIELSAYATDFAIGVVKSQLYQLADKNITKEEDDSGSIANEKA